MNKKPCVFCKGNHFNDVCNNVVSLQERLQVLKANAQCFNCLNTSHKSKTCRFLKPCFYCKELGHNRSVCPHRPLSETVPAAQKNSGKKCYVCGKRGHLSRNCSHRPRRIAPANVEECIVTEEQEEKLQEDSNAVDLGNNLEDDTIDSSGIEYEDMDDFVDLSADDESEDSTSQQQESTLINETSTKLDNSVNASNSLTTMEAEKQINDTKIEQTDEPNLEVIITENPAVEPRENEISKAGPGEENKPSVALEDASAANKQILSESGENTTLIAEQEDSIAKLNNTNEEKDPSPEKDADTQENTTLGNNEISTEDSEIVTAEVAQRNSTMRLDDENETNKGKSSEKDEKNESTVTQEDRMQQLDEAIEAINEILSENDDTIELKQTNDSSMAEGQTDQVVVESEATEKACDNDVIENRDNINCSTTDVLTDISQSSAMDVDTSNETEDTHNDVEQTEGSEVVVKNVTKDQNNDNGREVDENEPSEKNPTPAKADKSTEDTVKKVNQMEQKQEVVSDEAQPVIDVRTDEPSQSVVTKKQLIEVLKALNEYSKNNYNDVHKIFNRINSKKIPSTKELPVEILKLDDGINECKIVHSTVPEYFNYAHMRALLHLKTPFDPNSRYFGIKFIHHSTGQLAEKGCYKKDVLIRFPTHGEAKTASDRLRQICLNGSQTYTKLDLGYVKSLECEFLDASKLQKRTLSSANQGESSGQNVSAGPSSTANGNSNGVKPSVESNFVYIGPIPEGVKTYKCILELLKKHDCGPGKFKIKTGTDSNGRYAILRCINHEAAKQVVNKLKGETINGSTIIVKLKGPKDEKSTIAPATSPLEGTKKPIPVLLAGSTQTKKPEQQSGAEFLAQFKEVTGKRTHAQAIGDKDDQPVAAKKIKTDNLLSTIKVNTCFWPVVERDMSTYGLKEQFLRSLGISPPLSDAVFVHNLHNDIDAAKVYEIFCLAGNIKSLSVDNHNGKARARIVYDHPVEAIQAITMFDKQVLYNIPMVVKMDFTKLKRPLPHGLESIGKGLNDNGMPILGVRNYVETKAVQQILAQQGLFSPVHVFTSPFTVHSFKPEPGASIQPVRSTPSTATITKPPTMYSCAPDTSATQNKAIPATPVPSQIRPIGPTDGNVIALNAILVRHGLIDKNTRCNDLSDILSAIRVTRDKTTMENQQESNAYVNEVVKNLRMASQNLETALISQPCPVPSPYFQQNIPSVTPVPPMVQNVPTFAPNVPTMVQEPNRWHTSGWDQPPLPPLPVQPPVQTQAQQNFAQYPQLPLHQNMLGFQGHGQYDTNTAMNQNNSYSMPQSTPQVMAQPAHTITPQVSKISPAVKTEPKDKYNDDSRKKKKDKDNDSDGESDFLLFSNLPASVNIQALNSKMREVGDLMFGEMTGKGRAIVRFKQRSDAKRCIKLFHRSKVDGQVIDVKFM